VPAARFAFLETAMRKDVTAEPFHLHRFQDEFFREAIQRHVREYTTHFGERLGALYVSDSVHRNEARAGLSDLDLHPFISDAITEFDREWWQRARKELDRELGQVHGLVLPRSVTVDLLQGMQAASRGRCTVVPDPADGTLRWQPDPDERKAKLAREYGLLLRYDATLVWGCDLLEGLHVPPPDRPWAQVWFLSPWELTRYAGGLAQENRTDFHLPEELTLRLHELAKLAKLGGVALVMARGEFCSYRAADVLPALSQLLPEWSSFLDQSSEYYFPAADPTPEQVSAYLSRLVAWMEWIGAELHLTC
jgi:hypothetical protein